MAELNNKTALVTGASGGIGRAIARQLAAAGARLLLHTHHQIESAELLAKEIRQSGGEARVLQQDLSQPGAAAALADNVKRLTPHLDILVNNAGKGGRKPLETLSEAEFGVYLHINLIAPMFLIQQLLPVIRDGGRIINISSIGTRSAWPQMAAYAPTKAALDALTLLLAPQVGERRITINSVRPGATATAMNPAAQDAHLAAETARQIALGRVGQPEDIAKVVAFLASENGGWITGQYIDASGGQRL
ncbi:short-chain dehydrogenase [Izhakiella australiensis]|uniref:Short-chain dehydrogenase n=1 Tax=Izhakiella australiensis TaxID=1926881 RepID=A0A1S8YPP6_9GAMM|nr:SDR family oxidoreductase [Izhakiella australiensis]OON41040.1 short-chain dehydrogenase [Izhakiella australiensis]